MLNRFRGKFNKILLKSVSTLDRLKFKPWMLSLLGLILVTIATIILMVNTSSLYISSSLVLFLLGGLMDALDGSLARFQNKVSNWGGFYDSVIDRITEIIYVFGLAYAKMISFNLAYIYITTSILISYTRARGEALGVKMQGVGIMERAERLLILVFAIILWIYIKFNLDILIGFLALLNIITFIQRIYYVWIKTKKLDIQHI